MQEENKAIDVPVMWTVKDAVKETRLSESFIRKLVKEKKVYSIVTGPAKGKILISAESLCAYMRGTTEH